MEAEYLLKKSIEKIDKFNRFGSKPGLERVSELLNRLDNPQKDLKVIHVGGTNGKGSVCRYVYSVLQNAGYKCGLFISPYIEEFTERIEFNGSQISPKELFEITSLVVDAADEMVKEGLESPTEFEVITAVAFLYYKKMNVDAVILEVGLGGRGDSTNIIEKSLVSCITSISYDHMDYLGNTLGKIAWEKAGIIKSGCPVVFCSDNQEVIRVIAEKAEESGSERYNCAECDYKIIKEDMGGIDFNLNLDEQKYEGIRINMPGHHQLFNSACAVKIIEILKSQHGFSISDSQLRNGLKEAKMPGRIEIVTDNPLVVLDGSHNRDSIRALKEWVINNFDTDDRFLIVTGVLKDKEYQLMAEILSEIGKDFIITEPDNPRKLNAEIYKAEIEKHLGNEGKAEIVKDAEKAAEYAFNRIDIKSSEKHDYKGLIFTGSLYMIGVVRKKIKGMLTEV